MVVQHGPSPGDTASKRARSRAEIRRAPDFSLSFSANLKRQGDTRPVSINAHKRQPNSPVIKLQPIGFHGMLIQATKKWRSAGVVVANKVVQPRRGSVCFRE